MFLLNVLRMFLIGETISDSKYKSLNILMNNKLLIIFEIKYIYM